jgi:hypothetical protein
LGEGERQVSNSQSSETTSPRQRYLKGDANGSIARNAHVRVHTCVVKAATAQEIRANWHAVLGELHQWTKKKEENTHREEN